MTPLQFWRAAADAIPCGETDLPFSLALRVAGDDTSPVLLVVLADHGKTDGHDLPDVLQVDGVERPIADAARNAGGFPVSDADAAVYREAVRWIMRAVLEDAGPLRVVEINLDGGN